MNSNPEEKRRFKRLGLHAGLRYHVRGSLSEFIRSVTDDISEGGLSLRLDKFLSPNTHLNMEIDLLSRVLHPIGRVAWCAPLAHSDRKIAGVEFIEIDPLEKSYLQDYINMQTGQL